MSRGAETLAQRPLPRPLSLGKLHPGWGQRLSDRPRAQAWFQAVSASRHLSVYGLPGSSGGEKPLLCVRGADVARGGCEPQRRAGGRAGVAVRSAARSQLAGCGLRRCGEPAGGGVSEQGGGSLPPPGRRALVGQLTALLGSGWGRWGKLP